MRHRHWWMGYAPPNCFATTEQGGRQTAGGGRPTNAKQVPPGRQRWPSCCAKAQPLGKSSDAVHLEVLAAGRAGLQIEVVARRGVNSCEILQSSQLPEPKHCPFSTSEWLVRILGPIVGRGLVFLPIADGELPLSRGNAMDCCPEVPNAPHSSPPCEHPARAELRRNGAQGSMSIGLIARNGGVRRMRTRLS